MNIGDVVSKNDKNGKNANGVDKTVEVLLSHITILLSLRKKALGGRLKPPRSP
jgi:hypothetical protein